MKGKQEKSHDQRLTEERSKAARARRSILPGGLHLLSTLTREIIADVPRLNAFCEVVEEWRLQEPVGQRGVPRGWLGYDQCGPSISELSHRTSGYLHLVLPVLNISDHVIHQSMARSACSSPPELFTPFNTVNVRLTREK